MLSLSQRFVKVFRLSPFFHFFLKSIISNDQESVTALRMLESKMRGRAKKSTNLTELGNQKVSEAAITVLPLTRLRNPSWSTSYFSLKSAMYRVLNAGISM